MAEETMDNPFGMPMAEETEDLVVEALRTVVATPEGRTLLWAILGQAQMYTEQFHGNSGDIYEKGKRSIGIWIIDLMYETDPTIYPRMLLDVARREQRLQKLAEQKQEQDK